METDRVVVVEEFQPRVIIVREPFSPVLGIFVGHYLVPDERIGVGVS
jgi:hypothetical protein